MKKDKVSLSEYQKICKKTARKFKDKEKEIMTWGLGITGEAGDLAGCIKKTYTHDNDQKEGIRENLGDVLWYGAMICNYFDWNFEDILKENIEKLNKRYQEGFTEKEARRGGTKKDWLE